MRRGVNNFDFCYRMWEDWMVLIAIKKRIENEEDENGATTPKINIIWSVVSRFELFFLWYISTGECEWFSQSQIGMLLSGGEYIQRSIAKADFLCTYLVLQCKWRQSNKMSCLCVFFQLVLSTSQSVKWRRVHIFCLIWAKKFIIRPQWQRLE